MGRKRTRWSDSAGKPPKLDPEALAEATEPADRVLQIRLTASEHEEIKQIAQRLGLTMTAYLLGLHRQAVEALKDRRRT